MKEHLMVKESKLELESVQPRVVREPTEDEMMVSQMIEWLMPWVDKSGGEERMGDWEVKLPEVMMMKILELWLSERNRKQLEDMLQWYHPLDRAAMAYALVVYVMTGKRMSFKNKAAEQHFKLMRQALKEDMVELTFAGHMKYMIRRYGPNKGKKVKR